MWRFHKSKKKIITEVIFHLQNYLLFNADNINISGVQTSEFEAAVAISNKIIRGISLSLYIYENWLLCGIFYTQFKVISSSRHIP
jgi:hypothetical protein